MSRHTVRLDSKEQTAHLINYFLITARCSAVKALEGCENKVGWIKAKDRLAAFEITCLGLGLELAILDRDSPLSAPLT